jgi:Cu(I)/Ag(I) efflux system membrane protein CusA/SilA
VEIVTTYDRSALIERAIRNLATKLGEFLVVALVCLLFLWHLRSALVAIIALPLGVMTAFLVMRIPGDQREHHVAGASAIAVGAMVDAAVVMIENAHKKLEAWQHAHPDQRLQGEERWEVITQAAEEVGPALFFSLLIITLSFIPSLPSKPRRDACSARWRSPRPTPWRRAGLSVTLIPVLMGYWIRGRVPDEQKNPITRMLIAVYRPSLEWVLRRPKATC